MKVVEAAEATFGVACRGRPAVYRALLQLGIEKVAVLICKGRGGEGKRRKNTFLTVALLVLQFCVPELRGEL